MNKNDFKKVQKDQKLDIEQTRASLTYWQDVWRRLKKNKSSMAGLAIVILIILFAVVGPLFTPFSYEDQVAELRNLPPRLDVYEVEDDVYIHRTEAFDLIQFDEDGKLVGYLENINKDEDNKIYYYSYLKIYDYELITGGDYPLPSGVTLDADVEYSDVWGIGLKDQTGESGDNEVVISYVHPDSPFLNGELTNGTPAETFVGLIVDQFIMADDISNPELVDYFTIKSDRGADLMISDMEKKFAGTTDYKGKLASIKIFSEDILILDFGLLSVDPEDSPAGYEDVDYILTYKGTELKQITDSFGNSTYPWGTDALGRDVLTRVMYGARISLLVAFIASTVNMIIGITYGSISGFAGGNTDNIMMRIVDIINSIPLVLYVILIMVVLRERVIEFDIFGNHIVLFNGRDGFTAIVIALASVYWVGMARLVRGQVLGLKEQEFVLAARTIGVEKRKIIFRHLIPNALGPIIVTATMMIPSAVFTEAFLSFIGIGVSAPAASLGTLCNEALGGIRIYTYQLIYPSLAIAFMMLGFNFLGDGLRDALDPRLRKG